MSTSFNKRLLGVSAGCLATSQWRPDSRKSPRPRHRAPCKTTGRWYTLVFCVDYTYEMQHWGVWFLPVPCFCGMTGFPLKLQLMLLYLCRKHTLPVILLLFHNKDLCYSRQHWGWPASDPFDSKSDDPTTSQWRANYTGRSQRTNEGCTLSTRSFARLIACTALTSYRRATLITSIFN